MADDQNGRKTTPADGFALLSAPVLVNASEDSITVLIAVSSLATGWVEYGTTEALGQREDGQKTGMLPLHPRFLRFEITGLSPGKRYFYRVHACGVIFRDTYKISRGNTIASETFSFRTLDAAAPVATFTCWNDTHEVRPTLAGLGDLLRRNPTDFLVWNGDITNDIQNESQMVEQFLNPAGQPFAASVPLYLGRGNHDVRGRDARKLSEMITGPGGRSYYAFRQGPLACIVMDTGEDKPDTMEVYAGLNDFAAYRTEQAHWLSKLIHELWFKEASFRVAFLHIPLVWETEALEVWEKVWGIGIKGWLCEDGYNKWHHLLVDGKVDAVISGHIHHHITFPSRSGRPYTQFIGGGPQIEGAVAIIGHANSETLRIGYQNLHGTLIETHSFQKQS